MGNGHNGPLTADIDTSRRFLAAIDPDSRVDAPHAFHTMPAAPHPDQKQRWDLSRSPDQHPKFDAPLDRIAPELVRLNADGAQINVGINRRVEKKVVLRACCCSWVDGEYGTIDGYTVPLRPTTSAKSLTKVRAGVPPSLVVRTSRGVQWWWLLHAHEGLLDEAVEKWTGVQKALAKQFGGETGLHYLDSTMLVPGFLYQGHEPLDLILHRRVEEELHARIERGDYDLSWGTPACHQVVRKEYSARGGHFDPVKNIQLEKCDPTLRYEIGRIVRSFELNFDPPPAIVPPEQMPVPAPHIDDARRFLSALDPSAERHTFQTHDDQGSNPELAKILHGTLNETIGALTHLNSRRAAIYASVNATDFKGRKSRNILSTRAFFVDWDDDVPPRGSGALPISILTSRADGTHDGPPPRASRRRRHAYWLLSESVPADRWKLVQRALVKRLKSDPSAILLSQALRLPGFYNNKTIPHRVELDECHPDRRYTVDQVIDAYRLAELIKPPAPKPPRSSTDGGPADDYNARGDWSVLDRAGWTVSLRIDQESRWAKPGAKRKEIHATTDYDGNIGIFKCFSSKAPPFEGGKGYSRFQVLAELEFGGNWSSTAKHLVEQGYGKSNASRSRERAEFDDHLWTATLHEAEAKERTVKKANQSATQDEPPEWDDDLLAKPPTKPSRGSEGADEIRGRLNLGAYNPDGAPTGEGGGTRKPPAPPHQGASGGGGGGGGGGGDMVPAGDGNAPVLLPLNSVTTYANGPDQLVKSHLGNSERFLDRYANVVRYVKTFDSWFVWNGTRWRKDADAEETHVRRPTPTGTALEDYITASNPDPFDAGNFVQELGKQLVRSMHALTTDVFVQARNEAGIKVVDATGKPKKDEDKTFAARKKWISHCVFSECEGAIRQILNLSRSDRKIARFPSYFDPYDHLLNTEGGVFDLRTGLRYDHHPGLLQSKLVRIKPKRGGCPIWTKFLGRVLQDDDDLIRFVQRAVGYSLTGDTREQVLFLLYGTGRNGKSTFLNVLTALAGEYAQHAEFSTFVERQNETVRNDLARLHKSRLVTAVEPKASGYLDESVIKQVTGQDTVTARFLFQEHFEYIPRFKIWLAANHKPMIRGNDEGIWRRILMVPFTVTIPEEEKDPDLPNKLIAELPAIFAWAADGARLWYEEGLRVPSVVRDATQAYRDEMDSIGIFITTMCTISHSVQARATSLYEHYRKWAEGVGEKPLSQKKFGMRLEERGIVKKRKKNGIEYLGIGVLTDASDSFSDSLPYRD